MSINLYKKIVTYTIFSSKTDVFNKFNRVSFFRNVRYLDKYPFFLVKKDPGNKEFTFILHSTQKRVENP